MNAQRLADAQRETLWRLAQEHSVEFSDETSREELIELIVEAMEESRREHEESNNNPVRVEETKYQGHIPETPGVASQADQGVGVGETTSDGADDEYFVPDTYNETRVVLLLRDPAWAFAYWDVRDSDVRAYRKRDDFDGLALRVHQLHEPAATGAATLGSFDIPIGLLDNRWYIHLPGQETSYRIDLVARCGDSDETLATSNVIYVPRGGLADRADDAEDPPADEILAQTGIHDMDVRPVGSHLSQRIVSLIDEDLMFN